MPITKEQYLKALETIQKYEDQQQKELRVYQTQERARDSRLDCTSVGR